MADTIIISQCEYCGKDVEKFLRRVTYSHKHNLKMFCNKRCILKYRAKQRRDSYIIPLEKTCTVCGEIKLLYEFPITNANLDGKMNKCKICYAKYYNQWYKKHKYGITPDDETKIFDCQGGICAICGRDLALFIDHNHITGVVRGLLCFNCNIALGSFNDDPDNLRKAADYLESEFNEN